MDYSLTQDIGRLDRNYSVSIYNKIHSNKSVDENGFSFQFTCNNDERVYYNAYFLRQIVKIHEYRPDSLKGVQIYYNIDLFDVNKLGRDYPSLTENKVVDIINQLMPLCIEVITSGQLNRKGIMFNVDI